MKDKICQGKLLPCLAPKSPAQMALDEVVSYPTLGKVADRYSLVSVLRLENPSRAAKNFRLAVVVTRSYLLKKNFATRLTAHSVGSRLRKNDRKQDYGQTNVLTVPTVLPDADSLARKFRPRRIRGSACGF